MSHRFLRCPHCTLPHDAEAEVCPATGKRLSASDAPRSRMHGQPPPQRAPTPLGFDAVKNRIGDSRPSDFPESSDVISPTRGMQMKMMGQVIGDRYKIHGILGEGGMGTVYAAEHLGLSRFVAVKILNPSQARKRASVKRFQQEARAAGAIGHPNICEVYDMGQLDDGSPYLVMEKLDGQTLAARIVREGGLPFDEILDAMVQVLSGLIAAHEKGIVHRDIKPENIFLVRRAGASPIAKILDFGVSKMMSNFQGGDAEPALDLTRTGMVMGTPYYMSPEQARGERNLDGRVDVYACGVMMYEAICGKRPYLAANYNALLLAIINTTPRSLREVRPATPAALEAIVLRSMAKARADRYPSAGDLQQDIQKLITARAVGGAGAIDRRIDSAQRPSGEPPLPNAESISVEIPIEVSESDAHPLPETRIARLLPLEEPDEAPTEVFRQSPDAHAKSAEVSPREGAPPTARPSSPDEWDGVTRVMIPVIEEDPSETRPFSIEQTVKLDDSIDVELEAIEKQHGVPPKRP
ncbi:Serine/threonine protein kinase [Labilithrix luteola]|uniref:Serine/threonine protein kinase n=1 Tax=Labilithrix luteola TaxID=1391654 RepID=A0A0K1PUC8_9BACT|nr:serine/threonine-protein kinase [Labilithrix luteola]AKU96714.1 Serine/threonine protein kinase [Labilithrix luteola]